MFVYVNVISDDFTIVVTGESNSNNVTGLCKIIVDVVLMKTLNLCYSLTLDFGYNVSLQALNHVNFSLTL